MDKPATKLNATINTPCVGICSTVYGDEVCRGCKRFYKEIIDWNTYAEPAKDAVFERLSHLMSNTVSQFLRVSDATLLQQQLDRLQIRYHATDDAFCWAHHLLRFLQDKSAVLKEYGIEVHPAYVEYNLRELFTLIDSRLYAVAGDAYLKA